MFAIRDVCLGDVCAHSDCLGFQLSHEGTLHVALSKDHYTIYGQFLKLLLTLLTSLHYKRHQVISKPFVWTCSKRNFSLLRKNWPSTFDRHRHRTEPQKVENGKEWVLARLWLLPHSIVDSLIWPRWGMSISIQNAISGSDWSNHNQNWPRCPCKAKIFESQCN